jgi:GNAT superfamily N-acetyltransferase
MATSSIRPATVTDRAAILALADRLGAFDPATRTAAEIASREARALGDALTHPPVGSALLVAENGKPGLAGVLFLETRKDYFTGEPHGHVAILAVAKHAEGQGLGRALLRAAEEWGRAKGFSRLTLSVFADNHRAREFYARDGWRAELETYYKPLQ